MKFITLGIHPTLPTACICTAHNKKGGAAELQQTN